MNIKKIIIFTLMAVPLLFLAKWGIETVIYDSNKIPDINPHPTQKVRIHGFGSQELRLAKKHTKN